MAATIKDIAKRLNLSVSTVSYALNGGPKPVSAGVRDRVLQLAEELGYKPNRVAQSLVTRRTHTIGVVPTEPELNLAQTPYFQGCFNGILNEAEVLDQDVLVFARYDHDQPRSLAINLLDGRVDGLIFLAPPVESHVFDYLRDKQIPFVVLSSEVPGAPVFTIDNRQGVSLALTHLYELGHRKIAHIAGRSDLDDAIKRRNAFLEVMAELGLPIPDGYVLEGDFTIESARDLAIAMFGSTDRPTAVFCANDEMAAGVARAAWECGIDVPEDISIVGFDAAQSSAIAFPPITTVRQPLDQMSASALRGLVRIIEGDQNVTGELFATELVRRASTSTPPEVART